MSLSQRLRIWIVGLAGGVLLQSCAADFRDALLAGAMDAVSGTVEDSIRTVFPLADILAAAMAGAGG